MVAVFGGPGIVPSSRGVPSAAFPLQAGATYIIPAGSWAISAGNYGSLQRFDPVVGIWRHFGDQGKGMNLVVSDGNNYRVANTTGCAAGALLTNAGTGYTSAPAIAPSAGTSIWQAVMGSLVSTTATVVTGGASYIYPPICQIASPSFPGIQATATATLTAGAVSSITITNQGGGYLIAPQINLFNDPRDTTGYGANATLALTGSGTVNGVVCVDHGNPLTAVPTLTFTGGGGASAAATVIMDFAMTGYTVTGGGSVFVAPIQIWGIPQIVAGTAAYTNPQTQTGIVSMRQGSITGAVAAGAVTATGALVVDGGHYQTVPSAVYATPTPPATLATLVLTVGGQTANIVMLAV
jgi:hypothetical protein